MLRFSKKRFKIIVSLCVSLSQQDLVLNVWCYRNVGQPISGEAVHRAAK